MLVLGILAHTLEVLQLDSQNHVFGFRQEVDLIVAQPELTSAAEERAKPSDRDGLQAVCTLVRSMIVDIKSTETKVRSRVFFFSLTVPRVVGEIVFLNPFKSRFL